MMKRTVIGGILMLSGVMVTMSIIMAASIYTQNITAWSGSKLWYVIFGADVYGDEVSQSLFLATPFEIGISLAVVGLIILVIEYFMG